MVVFSVRFLLLDNSLGSASGSHLYHRCDDGNLYDCDYDYEEGEDEHEH